MKKGMFKKSYLYKTMAVLALAVTVGVFVFGVSAALGSTPVEKPPGANIHPTFTGLTVDESIGVGTDAELPKGVQLGIKGISWLQGGLRIGLKDDKPTSFVSPNSANFLGVLSIERIIPDNPASQFLVEIGDNLRLQDVHVRERMAIGIDPVELETPRSRLHVHDLHPTVKDLLRLSRNAGEWNFRISDEGSLLFGAGENDRMTITSAGNVGIGTDDFSAGAGDPDYFKFRVHGPSRITEGNLFVEGPIHGHTIWASDNIRGTNDLYVGGISRLGDNVVIGDYTTGGLFTPPSKLYIKSNNYRDFIRLDRTSNPTVDEIWDITPSNDGSSPRGSLRFVSGNDPKVTFLSNGNVGIGTTSPSALLEVSGEWTDLLRLVRERDSGDRVWNFRVNSNGSLHIRRDGTNVMVLRENGNVGIGTTSPSAKLDVRGDAHFSDSVGIGTLGPKAKLEVDGNVLINDALEVQGRSIFRDDLRLPSGQQSGSLLIGHERSYTSTKRLDVAGDVAFSSNLEVGGNVEAGSIRLSGTGSSTCTRDNRGEIKHVQCNRVTCLYEDSIEICMRTSRTTYQWKTISLD